jgi:hypothetical protein
MGVVLGYFSYSVQSVEKIFGRCCKVAVVFLSMTKQIRCTKVRTWELQVMSLYPESLSFVRCVL